MRLTDFFLGVLVGIGLAMLLTRCPPAPLAAALPVTDAEADNVLSFEQKRKGAA